jgi:hypothetical protein
MFIFGHERNVVGAGFVNNAGNVAGGAIKLEPGRKPFGGKSHRSSAGGGDGEHEW